MGTMATSGPTDVIVVGAPRSGTSLVAGLLADAGWATGPRLLEASEANPRGFHEDRDVTELNDELLVPHLPDATRVADDPGRLAWASVLDPGVEVRADDVQRRRMSTLLPASPGMVKDPRFAYTLDAWRPVLRPATSFVAVVRDPAEVAVSLRDMWRRDPDHFAGFELTVDHGLALWEAINKRLGALLEAGRWLVVDHAELLAGTAVEELGAFVGRPLDAGGVDRTLHRSRTEEAAPSSLRARYADLRSHAATRPRVARRG